MRSDIDQFISAKQEENNDANRFEYTRQEDVTETCARTDANVRRKQPLVKTSVVHNPDGPLSRITKSPQRTNTFDGVEERISNAEEIIQAVKAHSATPIDKNIYARLKVLEDKLVDMENETSRLITSGVLPPNTLPFFFFLFVCLSFVYLANFQ